MNEERKEGLRRLATGRHGNNGTFAWRGVPESDWSPPWWLQPVAAVGAVVGILLFVLIVLLLVVGLTPDVRSEYQEPCIQDWNECQSYANSDCQMQFGEPQTTYLAYSETNQGSDEIRVECEWQCAAQGWYNTNVYREICYRTPPQPEPGPPSNDCDWIDCTDPMWWSDPCCHQEP